MKRLLPLFCILVVLVVSAVGVASAEKPQPGDFSTTGYTTNLKPIPVEPFLAPADFEVLAPSTYAKFHIEAQGGPAYNDLSCIPIYGVPCSFLCGSTDTPPPSCGVTGDLVGSFTFDEWGVADLGVIDPTAISTANHGLQAITTTVGVAESRFGGISSSVAVTGSFTFLKGSGDYHDLKGEGTYAGNAGAVFKVDYASCGGKDNPECPVDRCAVFGDDLKIKNDKTEWRIDNEGEATITLNTLFVYWSAGSGDLEKVKLGGKTLWPVSEGPAPAPAVELTLTADVKNREIKAGKSEVLTLEFTEKDISKVPSDYTILAKFAEGCAVPFVAFKDVP